MLDTQSAPNSPHLDSTDGPVAPHNNNKQPVEQCNSIPDIQITTDATTIVSTCPDGQVVLGFTTDCLLSLNTAWVQILIRTCEKVASDLGLGNGFSQLLVSYTIFNMAEKVTMIKITSSKSTGPELVKQDR